MTGVPHKGAVAVPVVRWAARVLGVVVLALVVRLLVSDWPLYGGAPSLADTVQFVALFATLCGYVLIWRWEGVGALVAIGGASCFLAVGYAGYGSMPPSFALLYLPGILAAICWWLATAEAHVSPVRILAKRPFALAIAAVELAAAVLVALCFAREHMPREGYVTGPIALRYRPAALGGPVALRGKALHRLLSRGYLGVSAGPLSPDQAERLGVVQGVVVTGVSIGSTAQASGVLAGDVIVKADGTPVATVQDLMSICTERGPNHTLRIDVVRGQAQAAEQLTLAVPLMNYHAAHRLRELALACAKCAEAVERDPRDATAYHNWGRRLNELGQYAEACDKYVKAVELSPGFAEAYADWGVALAHMGKRAEAIEKLNKAAELKPELDPQVEELRKQLLGKE
jgi:hypothetical protein